MQIELDEICTYTGRVNNKYEFIVSVHWNTADKNYFIKGVDFSSDLAVNFDKQKVVKRIITLIKGYRNEP